VVPLSTAATPGTLAWTGALGRTALAILHTRMELMTVEIVRRDRLARRQAELSARIEMQRLSLRMQARLLVTSLPWPLPGRRRQAALVLAGGALLGATAWLARGRVAAAVGIAWRLTHPRARLRVVRTPARRPPEPSHPVEPAALRADAQRR
jgi:hypothetical protein